MSQIYGYDHTTEYPNNPEFDASGDPVSAVDWLGNRFALGDKVIYCISAGRGQMMAIGVVVQIRAKQMKGKRFRYAEPGETPTRVVTWTDRECNLVDLDETYHAISVKVLTSKTSGHYDNAQRGRPAWVNAMNITSLSAVETP